MIEPLFTTYVYQKKLLTKRSSLLRELVTECPQIRDFDEDGREWSASHYPAGFTSYASRNDLFYMSSTFRELEEKIRPSVSEYAESLGYDMRGLDICISDMWVNIMGENCSHSGHIHPLSFVSGTFYVQVPPKGSAIRFEDPRLPFQMACPPKKEKISKELQSSVSLKPSAGDLILFESWLRHEVPPHTAKEERISVSFNYHWNSAEE